MKEQAEEWLGISLESLDLYGMRRYEEGSRLIPHVDNPESHVISVVINIKNDYIKPKDNSVIKNRRTALKRPWEFNILDHQDRLHSIILEQGEAVFYESTKCLHGRIKPLQGDYYVNLFAHFRPKIIESNSGDAKNNLVSTQFLNLYNDTKSIKKFDLSEINHYKSASDISSKYVNTTLKMPDIGTCNSNGTYVECKGGYYNENQMNNFLTTISPKLLIVKSSDVLIKQWEENKISELIDLGELDYDEDY